VFSVGDTEGLCVGVWVDAVGEVVGTSVDLVGESEGASVESVRDKVEASVDSVVSINSSVVISAIGGGSVVFPGSEQTAHLKGHRFLIRSPSLH